ncbi:transcriptional regulator BolA [Vibrio scophthalmi]|uniref:transcriptional regulator BolA n=1 Tax=Vibrio scophthalmi TaxID=45658 RepID=UPI002FF2ABE9
MLQQTIESKLHEAFQPSHLQVVNESYMHNVPAGSESHFKVIVVSEHFDGARLIARHRLVNQALSDELANYIHALSIHTYTAQEWQAQNQSAPDSPMCMGGSKA